MAGMRVMTNSPEKQEHPRPVTNPNGRTGGYHSCTCVPVPGNVHDEIKDDCPYHQQAAAHPTDHSIPWNCPTYWDGCNCRWTVRQLRERLLTVEQERDRYERALKRLVGSLTDGLLWTLNDGAVEEARAALSPPDEGE